MNIEAQVIGVPTGVQDYRPGALRRRLGGRARRRPACAACALDVDPRELERRLVLAYTGASRNSGINNWDVMVRRINGDAAVTAAFDGIRDAAAGVREALERADWRDVADACRRRVGSTASAWRRA